MKLTKVDRIRIDSLAAVFSAWGKVATRRVLTGAKKWGIPANRSDWFDDDCACPISYAAGWKRGDGFPKVTQDFTWATLRGNNGWENALSKKFTLRHIIAAAKKVLSL